MQIIDVPNNENFIRKVADCLLDGFTTFGVQPWGDLNEAIEEVRDSLAEDRISRAAVDESENVLGWIGGIFSYAFVWELHPLVVRADLQGKGIGTALVKDLEAQVKRRGGLTIQLGTDDEANQTSLGGIELYPNALEKIANIKNLKRHPFEFYQKLGYEITGIVPDANGFGKPDILMCKRI
ncbi:MAG: GNAT family N-acetyltransferase [Pyrinomonadaceae bacterium]|nr:GNAT family N-acetyltransferase [Pyrinomonadaceae bacterium]